MSVKKNSVSGLDALIDIAAGTETGGATDDLGRGQVYVATIIEEVYGGQEFSASLGENSPLRTAKLYKIKLQEELGNSQTGGELLSSTKDDLLELLPYGNEQERSDTANFLLNLLPEGMFMATNQPHEFPGKGDEVYATSDGGIEGRYILSIKGGEAKGTASGLLNSFDKPGNTAQKANEALTMKHQFKDENGELVEPKIRKSEMLAYIKQHLVPGAVGLRSDYGSRFHPVLKKAKMHFGVDVSTGRKLGVEIIAPSDGTVTVAKFQDEISRWRNGNYIKFKHDTGETSVYLHLHTISEALRPVNPVETKKVITNPKDRTQIPESQDTGAPADQRIGEERSGGRMAMTGPLPVKKGTVLGTIGTSGSSTGIHLHWSMGNNEDPYGAIKRWLAKEVG